MPIGRLQELLNYYAMVESKSITKDNAITLTDEEKGFLNKIQAKESEVAFNSSYLIRDFSLRGNATLTESEQDNIYAGASKALNSDVVWLNARQGCSILE